MSIELLTKRSKLLERNLTKLTKIEHIECYGKSIEVWYFPKDLTVKRWENFLQNKSNGNEDYLRFEEKDGRIITINPTHWGSVEVYKE